MKKSQQGLEDFEKAYIQNEQILFSIPSILIGISPEGFVSHWNSTAESAFGIPAGEILNQPFETAKFPWDASPLKAAVEACKKSGSRTRMDDLFYTRRDGTKGILGFTINPIQGRKKELLGLLLFGADITARREAEEQLRARTEELRLAHAKIEQ